MPSINLPPRTLVGYSNATNARAGDRIDFMVNVMDSGSYEADLVKIVNGDGLSRYADQFELRVVDAPFAGRYRGCRQRLNLGSYIQVENTGALDQLGSFTVAGWINPTFSPATYEPPDLVDIDRFYPPTLTIGARIKEQTIVSRFDAANRYGWTLYLDEDLRLVFAVGDGKANPVEARIDEPLTTRLWTYVMAGFDADTSRIDVRFREYPAEPGNCVMARTLSAGNRCMEIPQRGPLRIAAARGGDGEARAAREKPVHVFTGRIQDIRIFRGALGTDDLDAIASETLPSAYDSECVADWDFSRGIKTTQIQDISGNGQHGRVVNLAERGVCGRFWRGETIRWPDAPDLYDAIHFHADDLYDAEWQSDFSYTVPNDLPSGVYAARLKQGNFYEYIAFFVAAPKGRPRADLALWMADYDY